MRKVTFAAAFAALTVLVYSQESNPKAAFLEAPYLQLGDSPKLQKRESLSLLWHTEDSPASFSVQVKTSADKNWRVMERPATQAVEALGVPRHLVYRAQMTGLVPGEEFQYKVVKSGQDVFGATARARKSASQPFHFALFGDCAQDTAGQRAIAYQVSKTVPDFLFITGDIVYTAGRISEYRTKFFPVYAASEASPQTGAPLLQSVPFIAAPGNHDTAINNLGRVPDGLAYFLYWDQPLNGPVAGKRLLRELIGSPESQASFLAGARPRFPVMANFSFDYGSSHWTVLDSNPYMDWAKEDLRAWLEKDLASAAGATWRFVAFHHPGFNSSTSHFYDQWMRYLSPTFEKGRVDVVFSGHVHNYQRTFPLLFAPKGQTGPKGEVDGDYQFDKDFGDGAKSKPKGIVYIVSGGGGASLYNPELQATPDQWQPFTNKYVADTHSFSSVEIDGRKFCLRQIADDGREVDSFQISK